MARATCPRRGDVIWMAFNPQAGHEQAGHRPALVLSPQAYNRKVGLALVCPITSQARGYPFEVRIPEGLKAAGVILSDQIKSLDWRVRKSALLCTVPEAIVGEAVAKLGALLDL